MGVKCLAQEHYTMSPARARTRTARSGVERANHEATAPPTTGVVWTGLNYKSSSQIQAINGLKELENTDVPFYSEV